MSYLFSSVGKKYIMALTGIPLILFVTIHMIGNLQIFLGANAINKYAATLQNLGGLLWVARGSLIMLFLAHAFFSATLQIQNTMARPIGYKKNDTIVATFSSRTMIYSGLIIVAYLVFHIMHFTTKSVDVSFMALVDDQGRHDVYQMMILGFSNIYVCIAYFVAIFLLASHLKHGASSFFQSLGLNNPKYNCLTKCVGPVIAIIVFIGYGIVPLAVLLKWIN